MTITLLLNVDINERYINQSVCTLTVGFTTLLLLLVYEAY